MDKKGIVRLSIINEAVYHGSVCNIIRDEMGKDFCNKYGDCRDCVVMYMVGIFDQIRREGEWR